jgi:hypothetical protein
MMGNMNVSPGFTIENGADGLATDAKNICNLVGGEPQRVQAENFRNQAFAQLGAWVFGAK